MGASGALQAFAFLGFLTILVATAMQGPKLSARPQLQKTLPFLVGIFASLGLAAIINLFNVAEAGDASVAGIVPASGDALNVTLGLLGFLVPMALTMSAQTLDVRRAGAIPPEAVLAARHWLLWRAGAGAGGHWQRRRLAGGAGHVPRWAPCC